MNIGKFLLAGLVCMMLSPAAQAMYAGEFSADVQSQSGGQTMQMKMYSSNNKIRMEVGGMTTITRMDQKVSWILMPAERMYMEQPIDPGMAAKTAQNVDGEYERISMGVEQVNGETAEKFKVSYRGPSGEGSLYQWSRKDGIPVRIEAVDGSWTMDYRNIYAGPQPAALFEIPPGYQKMSLPNLGSLVNMDPSQFNMGGDE